MPQLLELIKTQISSLLRLVIEDDYGNVQPYTIFGKTLPSKWLSLIINILSVTIYLIIFLVFGLFLWNRGLQPVFPGLIAPIGSKTYNQYKSPEVQLLLTLFALFLVF